MKRTILCFTLLLSFTLLSLPLALRSQEKDQIRIAAAADLRFAMDSLLIVFKKTNPALPVTAVYGSSGNFFEQIQNGAPFDLFFSADIDYPRKLREQNKVLGEVMPYGTGQLVIWSKKTDPAQAKMNSLLGKELSKIAIANPAHAPYGKRAEESLRYYKIYDRIKDKLVMGENISQTAQYVTSGAADIGIIALSLALSPSMQQEGGKYWQIPAESHQPLRQGFVLLQHAGGNAGAKLFAGFMDSATATAILKYFGFGER
ncbi:MAG TPA: molybdate ABC transporter substrate-binding protein [Puia sp.]|nr:molybdate ABC transporter substrate-binding protein [Puia sp.]